MRPRATRRAQDPAGLIVIDLSQRGLVLPLAACAGAARRRGQTDSPALDRWSLDLPAPSPPAPGGNAKAASPARCSVVTGHDSAAPKSHSEPLHLQPRDTPPSAAIILFSQELATTHMRTTAPSLNPTETSN
ncbi:hypothetical protein PCL_02311 [Purpureocillium lilacinum]|uniref:Uncharacterized protein n=1 Tax=Purpureocillium lilacinum TaxID=33203 RepID=A0A2U3E068_PURLI|nr:hypothetical protein PCL_02311 [Purpureocillium lilacinum]